MKKEGFMKAQYLKVKSEAKLLRERLEKAEEENIKLEKAAKHWKYEFDTTLRHYISKSELHEKTSDRLTTERKKRRQTEGQKLILQREVDALEEKLEKKTRLLEMTDGYVLDLEQLRREDAEQIEAYKKDLLHVVRNLRKES